MSILVVVFIAGCLLQIMEATEPPNFASVPILLHFRGSHQARKCRKLEMCLRLKTPGISTKLCLSRQPFEPCDHGFGHYITHKCWFCWFCWFVSTFHSLVRCQVSVSEITWILTGIVFDLRTQKSSRVWVKVFFEVLWTDVREKQAFFAYMLRKLDKSCFGVNWTENHISQPIHSGRRMCRYRN